MLGHEVQTQKVNNKQSEMIDISGLNQGIYMIRVLTQNGSGTAKLVVTR